MYMYIITRYKLEKAGKLRNNHLRGSVLGLNSKMLVGGMSSENSATIEACGLINEMFTCETLKSNFENYTDNIFYAVDTQFGNC